ncbi:MAG: helix-turn-helix transcriptional regulator [Gemmatimonadota bacterium]|nr:helix-turn-helix transcriptional regulator [Gemmatimonadota bacterium]
MSALDGTGLRALLVAALAIIVLGGTIDLALDAPESWASFHAVFELLMISGAIGIAVVLWAGWWKSERRADTLTRSLAARREERDAWRASAEKALQGLGRAIHAQFVAWDLTPAEREVALLVLKGYLHKQIARLTGRSERTVRQHAASVYRKAGVSGRAELSAYFLEDLMLPTEERPEGD